MEAVGQEVFVTMAFYTAQYHGRGVAAEEVCLYGVVGITQPQLAAHHHSLEDAPAVAAHQPPVCNIRSRIILKVPAYWSKVFSKSNEVFSKRI
jgi:hypothetical protein